MDGWRHAKKQRHKCEVDGGLDEFIWHDHDAYLPLKDGQSMSRRTKWDKKRAKKRGIGGSVFCSVVRAFLQIL
jgi:hypothetical protein